MTVKRGLDLNWGELFNFVFEQLPSDPSLSTEFRKGYVYFNTATGKFRGYDGTQWVNLGGSPAEIIASVSSVGSINSGAQKEITHVDALNWWKYMPLVAIVSTNSYSGPDNFVITHGASYVTTAIALAYPNAKAQMFFSGSVTMEGDSGGAHYLLSHDSFGAVDCLDMAVDIYGIKIL